MYIFVYNAQAEINVLRFDFIKFTYNSIILIVYYNAYFVVKQ
jgi:hypothetical protein